MTKEVTFQRIRFRAAVTNHSMRDLSRVVYWTGIGWWYRKVSKSKSDLSFSMQRYYNPWYRKVVYDHSTRPSYTRADWHACLSLDILSASWVALLLDYCTIQYLHRSKQYKLSSSVKRLSERVRCWKKRPTDNSRPGWLICLLATTTVSPGKNVVYFIPKIQSTSVRTQLFVLISSTRHFGTEYTSVRPRDWVG